MIDFIWQCTRRIILPGVFLFLISTTVATVAKGAEVLLTPPGRRLVKDPSVVIPADFQCPNRSIKLPAYRDSSGHPASGWSARFVDTRRFASDQSAWIYFRDSDLKQSVSKPGEGGQEALRFWPVGTILILEIYQGKALQKENDKLIEIAAMSKTKADDVSFSKTFYPVCWSYARFDSDRTPSIDSAKVRECHQCHSIAFHLTGDMVFTLFP